MKRMVKIFPLVLLLSSCSPTNEDVYDEAVKLAESSKALYDVVSDVTALKLKELATKYEKNEDLTPSEWKVFRALRKFQPVLQGYSLTHQAYVIGLRVWRKSLDLDSSAVMPVALVQLMQELQNFVVKAGEMKDLLIE